MALIICPECGKKFSEYAVACPNCGLPMEKLAEAKEKAERKIRHELFDSVMQDVHAGRPVKFGRYPQTASGTDETPIEWIVINYMDQEFLSRPTIDNDLIKPFVQLISRYVLDASEFNSYPSKGVEDSDLFEWLNDSFYRKAFTAAEASILERDQVGLYDTGSWNGDYDFEKIARCEPTAYAVSRGLEPDRKSGNCYWWLSFWNSHYDSYYRCAEGMEMAALWENYDGNDVAAPDGSICKRNCNEKLGVRPVITIELRDDGEWADYRERMRRLADEMNLSGPRFRPAR